ncbi:hypothetical protein ACFQ5X_49285, partial [Streptomyces kaempferi]
MHDLLPEALDELGLILYPIASEAGREAAARELARRMMAGELKPWELTFQDVAARLGSTPHAVGRWRARFVRYRIAGLGDMPRPGGPRTVTDEQVAALV